MKKFIFIFFTALLFIMFVWFIIGYISYGDALFEMRLDLLTSINRVSDKVSFNIQDLIDSFKNFYGAFKFDDAGDILKLFYEPFKMAYYIIGVPVSIIIGIFEFLFFPVFI